MVGKKLWCFVGLAKKGLGYIFFAIKGYEWDAIKVMILGTIISLMGMGYSSGKCHSYSHPIFFVTLAPPPGSKKSRANWKKPGLLVETGFLSPSPTTFNNASFWEKLLGFVMNKFIKISKKRSPSKQKNFS